MVQSLGFLGRWQPYHRGAPRIDPSLVHNGDHSKPLSPGLPLPPLSTLRGSCPEKNFPGCQAAIDCHFCTELASIESLIFDTFMDPLISLYMFTVCHVSGVV